MRVNDCSNVRDGNTAWKTVRQFIQKEREIQRKFARRSHSKIETELGLEPMFLGSSSQFIPPPQYRHGLPRSVLHEETHTFMNKSELLRLPDPFCEHVFFTIGILTSITKL